MSAKKSLRKAKRPSTRRKEHDSKKTGTEALLKKAMPKWRPSERAPSDAEADSRPDLISPDLGSLQSKFPKRDSNLAAAGRADARTKPAGKSKGKLVVMEPESPSDAAVIGPKTQVVEDDEHIGSQG